MRVRIKKLHPDAVIPSYAKTGDAGLDLTAVARTYDEHRNIVYHFGLAFEIPQGYAGFIFPRSSVCKKTLILTNCVGVIDSGYRGEVTAKFKNLMTPDLKMESYKVGERVAQMVILPVPQIELEVVDSLSESERGEGGYGSSDKQ